MKQFTFSKNIKEIEKYRRSFNELVMLVFNFDFENWYNEGYWTENFQPYCYIDNDVVIANASVNKLTLIVKGERKQAIQISTVMTHPDYRGKGLSSSLMNKILDDFNNQYDIIYLFANKEVLNFYPKFGFRSIEEYQSILDYIHEPQQVEEPQKLNIKDKDDLNFIYQSVSSRTINS